MARAPLNHLVQQLRRLAGLPGAGALTDRQLLDRFVRHHEESAFAALVQRHGQLVLGVCRRVLQQEQDAEDAFQATFLVLARKAASVHWQESVSHWLYEVACRLARKAKVSRRQRQAREQQVVKQPAVASESDPSWREMQEVLDEELRRLPEKYRAPLVLCYLQGLTQDEAARRLGWTLGTVRGRLWRGRDLLKGRLERRRLALSAVLGATFLMPATVPAAVPPVLATATIQAGMHFAAGPLAAGTVPAGVLTLTEGMLKAMFMTKLQMTAVLLLAAGVLGAGTDLLGRHVLGQNSAPAQQTAAEEPIGAENPLAEEQARREPSQRTDDPARRADDRRPQRGENARREEAPRPDLTARVVAVSADGNKITVEMPSRERGAAQAPTKEILLTDKTQQTYSQVGPDGAKPTVGYAVRVYLVAGSQDTAARVEFLGQQQEKRPAIVAGKVVAVSADGKVLTLEFDQPTRGREPEKRKVDIKSTDKTLTIYLGVPKDGAKPTIGYMVRAELMDGSEDTAAKIYLGPNRGDGRGLR
jgi:RNA polymerase sigma factor (sigma-70 family)